MQTVAVEMPRAEAKALYQDYKRHLHYSKPIDQECMRAYQLLAQGRLIIRAIESVQKAGLKTEGPDCGFPKLAICRADAVGCTVKMEPNGGAVMHPENYQPRHDRRNNWAYLQSHNLISWPAGSFQMIRNVWRGTSLVPAPPLHLRPQRGLANYHILWEAEWTKTPPNDPYLLRRIGKSDMWVVVAMWNLTAVERAALSTRL